MAALLLVRQVLLWVIFVEKCDGVFKSSCYSTAIHASKLCELATPNITRTLSGPTVRVSGVALDQPLWLGYVKNYTAFSYIGCLTTESDGIIDEIADPSHCYSRCRTPYVGLKWNDINQKRCYCFDDQPTLLQRKKCENRCTTSVEFFCGHITYVSLYKTAIMTSTLLKDSPMNESRIKRHCLAYQTSPPGYFWSNCNNSFRFLCRHNNGQVYTPAANETWTESILSCLSVNADLVYSSYSSLSSIDSSAGGLFWIADIRSYTIVKDNTEQSGSYKTIQRGYIQKNRHIFGSDVRLQFGIDENFYALCISGDNASRCINAITTTFSTTNNATTPSTRASSTTKTIATTNVTATETNTTTTTTDNSTTTNPTITSTNISTTYLITLTPMSPPATSETTWNATPVYTHVPETRPSIHSTDTDKQHTTKEYDPTHSEGNVGENTQSEEKPNIVAVFVVIPVVLLIVAAVTVFIISRIRRNNRDKNDDSTEYRGVEQSKKSTNNAVVNASYQCDIPINPPTRTEPQHDYLILEPFNEYAAIKDTDLDNAENVEYNTTSRPKLNDDDGDGETGNVYNKLNDFSTDTYNHINTLDRTADNTYNHTGHNGGNATYNTTAMLSRPKEIVQVTTNENSQPNPTNDTYSHLGDTLARVDTIFGEASNDTKKNDTMGNPKQVAYAYAYAKPLPKRPLPSPDKGKQKYDYAYATANDDNDTSKRQVVFNFDNPSATGGYELAKDVPTGGSYELAKPPGDYELAKPPDDYKLAKPPDDYELAKPPGM